MTAPSKSVMLAYIRVSTSEQSNSGLSLSDQHQRLSAYAQSQGMGLYRVYSDPGISGTVPPSRRPGLRQLLSDLDGLPRNSASVAVTKLDRLGRNARELLILQDQFSRRGVALVSLSESLDGRTASGRALGQLIAVFAELEASTASERTATAMRSALTSEYARLGGVPPIGFSVGDAGHFVPNPEEVPVVRAAFAVFLETRSFAATARYLNGLGYRSRSGRCFSHATIGIILRSPAYRGDRCWARSSRKGMSRPKVDWVVVHNAHPALVAPEAFAKVAKILAHRDTRRAARRRRAFRNEQVVAV